MIIHDFTQTQSLLSQYVKELRDVNIQTDRWRFRKNIERIGKIMAYEISKHLPYSDSITTTPLGTHQSKVLKEHPVLITILRAGLSMHHGVLSFFDQSDCGFISAYRNHHDDHTFDIVVEYLATPQLADKTVLLIDPMLASGQSIESAYNALLRHGKPAHLHIVSLIGSSEGVSYLTEKLPFATLWIAAIDDELNPDKYIVPGLGDAGDLSFGDKI
jgi:uracil phosphoribosyltransferase